MKPIYFVFCLLVHLVLASTPPSSRSANDRRQDADRDDQRAHKAALLGKVVGRAGTMAGLAGGMAMSGMSGATYHHGHMGEGAGYAMGAATSVLAGHGAGHVGQQMLRHYAADLHERANQHRLKADEQDIDDLEAGRRH